MEHYAPVLPLFLLAIGVALLISFLSRIMGPSSPSVRKAASYESGMRPIGAAVRRIPVKFYRVGMLFILFDIEVIFFLPWAVVLRDLGLYGLAVMGVFFFVLIIGFAYEWMVGGLEWE
ncbi:MAG: NADH-quinone oxidoreductase subunit A [Phototrophicales bacterium]|nr:MAG: NADH-quinone oxidoreductase subunit A [Phototrophicales bacterium]